MRGLVKRLEDLEKTFSTASPRSWVVALNAWARSAPDNAVWGNASVKTRWLILAPRVVDAIGRSIASSSDPGQLDAVADVLAAAKATVLAGALQVEALEMAVAVRRKALAAKPPEKPPRKPIERPIVKPIEKPIVPPDKTVAVASPAKLPLGVRSNMARVEQFAASGKSREAVGVMCGGLIDMCRTEARLSPEHVEWQDLLDWSRKTREAHPGLDQMGRSQLKFFERDVEGLVKQQEEWLKLLGALEAIPGKDEKVETIDEFVRRWYGSPYRQAAERIKAELVRGG